MYNNPNICPDACPPAFYSGCQKNVPIAERFFATTLMPPSFFSEH
jgi:hypothetical protein